MRIETTNLELMNLANNVKELENSNPILKYFLHQKFENFHKRNSMSLKLLHNKVRAIKLSHASKDEEGEAITIEKNGNTELQYPSDEAKKLCAEELTEFLSRSVTIEF